MEEWIPAIIGAVLGGTGIASLISGGAQLTARTRLKHRIETLRFARTHATLDSTKRQLTSAIERDSLRLASFSIIRGNPIWISAALGISSLAMAALILLLWSTPDEAYAELLAWERLDEYKYTAYAIGIAVLLLLLFIPSFVVMVMTRGTRAGWVDARIDMVDSDVERHLTDDRSEPESQPSEARAAAEEPGK